MQARVDLFNVFNANPVLAQNNTYGTSWLRPTNLEGPADQVRGADRLLARSVRARRMPRP